MQNLVAFTASSQWLLFAFSVFHLLFTSVIFLFFSASTVRKSGRLFKKAGVHISGVTFVIFTTGTLNMSNVNLLWRLAVCDS